MPHWQTLDARLSVFVAPDTVVPDSLYRDAVGEEPENTAIQRLISTRVESGPFADGALDLQIQPFRIDWNYHLAGVPSSPFLGSFPPAAEPLLSLSRRWVASTWFPSANRLALAFTLLSRTDNRESGYRELNEFVDGVPTAPDATDFLYQLNRPRPSGIGFEGMSINRLSRWSVAGQRLVTVTPATSHASDMQLYLRLELDINTSAEFQGVIPRERIDSVIADLFTGAREVSERGTRF